MVFAPRLLETPIRSMAPWQIFACLNKQWKSRPAVPIQGDSAFGAVFTIMNCIHM
jgi:hypothetical protein